MDLNTKRIRPNVKYVYRASAKVQQSYGLGDLGKDGIPGSKLAMFGLVITLVTAFMGSLGCFTSLIGIGILIAAYLKGFKSTWVWVGIALGVCLLCRSFAILSAELDYANQRAWDDIMSSGHTAHGRTSNHRRLNIARRTLQNRWKFDTYADMSAERFLWKEFVGYMKNRKA